MSFRRWLDSCDVFFYRVAQKLKSVDDIAKWAKIFGLGKKTGIDERKELSGLIPTEEWKQKTLHQPWNGGETASVAIGQSYVSTTTIQLANLYAAISNGGTLFKPFVVKNIESAEGSNLQTFSPEILSKVRIADKTKELVKEGLWGVVNTPIGTAYAQRLPGMDFSGKTGTVQVFKQSEKDVYTKCEKLPFKLRHHAVFVGFAPVEDPLIVVAVLGEHECHGSYGAAPIARAVIKTYLEKYYPQQFGEKIIAQNLKLSGGQTEFSKHSSLKKDLFMGSQSSVEDSGFESLVSSDIYVNEEEKNQKENLPVPMPLTPSETID